MQNPYESYVCRECGKRKPGNYFISDSLCKKCAAKRRIRKSNELVTISADTDITERVKKRLEKSAGNQVPLTLLDWIARVGSVWIYFLLIYHVHGYGFFLGWIPAVAIYFVLSIPREKNLRRILLELTGIRKRKIEEAQQFYSSPEWRTLREKVIEKSPKKCVACNAVPTDKKDLTVDHIKPRSKYPKLALKEDNLQILCRSCNARKGAKVT
jgi:hypothetical protein